jgi:hypothetical protein
MKKNWLMSLLTTISVACGTAGCMGAPSFDNRAPVNFHPVPNAHSYCTSTDVAKCQDFCPPPYVMQRQDNYLVCVEDSE